MRVPVLTSSPWLQTQRPCSQLTADSLGPFSSLAEVWGRSLLSGYPDGQPSHCRGPLYGMVSQLEKPYGDQGSREVPGIWRDHKGLHPLVRAAGVYGPSGTGPVAQHQGAPPPLSPCLLHPSSAPRRKEMGTLFSSFCRDPLPRRTHLFPIKTSPDRHTQNTVNIYCSCCSRCWTNTSVGLRHQL